MLPGGRLKKGKAMKKARTPANALGRKILKWIGIVSAVISLVLGVREVVTMIQDHIARRDAARGFMREARSLAASGNYARAEESAKQAVSLDPSQEAGEGEIAMDWLRNIRLKGTRREESFTDIAEQLLPVLYRAVDTTRPGPAADLFAHIGWADYLIYRDGDTGVRVDEQFQHALRLDSTNAYANAMEGFWMLYPGHPGGSLEEAELRFAAALKSGQHTAFVRELIIAAYLNVPSVACRARILRMVSTMRGTGDTLDLPERERILSESYFLYRNDIMTEASKVLTPQEHLDVFLTLTRGIDISAKPYLKQALRTLRAQAGVE